MLYISGLCAIMALHRAGLSIAQVYFRVVERWCTFHDLSWTNSITPSRQFLDWIYALLGLVALEGSHLFRILVCLNLSWMAWSMNVLIGWINISSLELFSSVWLIFKQTEFDWTYNVRYMWFCCKNEVVWHINNLKKIINIS